jgi:PAS domain S-box-containing protein
MTQATSEGPWAEPGGEKAHTPPYGDLTQLNRDGLILNSVGRENLHNIAADMLDPLGTSCAVYERNGDYAAGIFSSRWCRCLDDASFELCGTSNLTEALNSGKWLCHEACWTGCSKLCIETNEPVDIACTGGIRIYCVPIRANGKAVGAINVGYGTPPKDPDTLKRLAAQYQVDAETLRQTSADCESHGSDLIDRAKRRLHHTALLIGTLVENRLAQESLHESELRLRHSQEVAQLGSWELDLANNSLTWSEETYRIFGLQPDQFTGKPDMLNALVHPDDLAHLQTTYNRSLEKQQDVYDVRHRIIHAQTGQTRWVHEKCRHVRNRDGRIVRAEGIVQDITEQTNAEAERRAFDERLQQTQRLESLGVLAGGIAHDFNNILMGIMGHAELALDELSPLSPVRQSLNQISTCCKRAAELCGQMLAYAGKGQFEQHAFSMHTLIEETLRLIKTSICKKHGLTLHLNKQMGGIYGDPSQVRQVIMNLVINASEAIGEHSGTITLSSGVRDVPDEGMAERFFVIPPKAGSYVYVSVKDSGCGMDDATLQRVFDPFFTTKFAGRGLGLSAVLGIVRSHHGALQVETDAGHGTTFTVLFPVIHEPEIKTLKERAASGWRGKGTVLLVDDEETVRTITKQLLKHLGLQVLTANDGQAGVALYRKRMSAISMVLLDLTMPTMDGEEAFRELKKINPAVRVVVASGHGSNDVAERFGQDTLAGHLQKPYTLEKLRTLLATIIPSEHPAEPVS